MLAPPGGLAPPPTGNPGSAPVEVPIRVKSSPLFGIWNVFYPYVEY